MELFRQWVEQNKPLVRVKDELDRLNPLADQLYQTGNSYYMSQQFDEAIDQLQRSLSTNPNHLKAKLLLGRIWIEKREVPKAIEVLENAFSYDEASARALLVQALLAQAEEIEAEDDKIAILERILQLQPYQLTAKRELFAIWTQRGDEALNRSDFSIYSLKPFSPLFLQKMSTVCLTWLRKAFQSKIESSFRQSLAVTLT